MSNEARITASLQIVKSPITYLSQPTSFTADVTGLKGPTPGAFTATTGGTDCNLSELVTPGFCRIQNLDDENYVEYGIYDPQTVVFYPLGEVGPGETYVLKFSRNLFEEYAGAGTGTTAPTNTFRFKANTASVNMLVEAFEK